MKPKVKKSPKQTLSDKIADALTVKPRADIEDDQVFGTKPHTVSRGDLSSSDDDVDDTISDFRKRNVNLLSEISKKYEGQVVSREEHGKSQSESEYEESDSEEDSSRLTVQDLLLNEDSEDSEGENSGTIEKKQNRNTKTNGINVSDDSDESSEKESKSPSKSNKNTAKTLIKQKSDKDSNSKINAILKSFGSFEPSKNKNKPNNKTSGTDSEISSDEGSDEEDYGITQFQQQLNKSAEKKQFKKPAESISGSDHSSDEIESDDYSIHQKDESSGEEDEDGEEDGEEDEGYDISQMEEPPKEELFEHVKKQNVSEEAKKGACVRNQLLIWEGLLEMRIHLQRCVNTANQMPLPDTYETLKNDNGFTEECNATKTNIANVLEKLLTLQNLLLKKYPETKSLAANSKKIEDSKDTTKEQSDEEIPSDTDNEEIPSDTEEEDEQDPKDSKIKEDTTKTPTRKRKLEDYEKELSKSHKAFKMFRDTTIQKWNEKTRLATASSIKNTPTNTILQQISYILSDKEKLIKRTQLKRSEYNIIGYKKPSKEENHEENGTEMPVIKDRKADDEYISEIFDDSDFYHQLLRELIECKSADISDPVQLSRQWIALQQMRSKMKRKVDTKATKGRKIKYVLHNKLVNYMAPEKCTTWTDESTNELYSSLFGKLFENNNVGVNANLDNGFKIKN